MPFLEASAPRIHYQFDGPAHAPVLLLSNSLGTNFHMWDAQMSAPTRDWRVLRYDTRGHGQTGVTPGPYTLDQLGRDVIALLDGLNIRRVHFCGLSMGGMIGMWFALNAADRLGKLALCNTGARIGTAEIWNARIATVRGQGMNALVDGVLQRWFTEGFRAREPGQVSAIRNMLEATPAEGYAACSEAIRDADLRGEIARITAPTLVITGTHDPSTPAVDGRFIADTIRGARYVELDSAHLSNIEAQARFTQALTEFLSS